jgi:hypothetical protein
MTIFDSLLQDVRFALRTMMGRPLFTVTAVVSLALGIGANTAIYSFLDSILMRALPVLDPCRSIPISSRRNPNTLAPRTRRLNNRFALC